MPARQGYAKLDPERGLKRTDEFRKGAVRIALTSGLTTARQLISFGSSSGRRNFAVILATAVSLFSKAS